MNFVRHGSFNTMEHGRVRRMQAGSWRRWLDTDDLGRAAVDLDEVAEAKFVSLDQVRHIMQHEPESLTPWGRHDIAAMLNTCER